MADLQSDMPSSNVESNTSTTTNQDAPKEEVHDCFYFLTTGCSKGDQCKFRHKEDVKETNMLCHRYLHNGCFNPDCKFIHLKVLPSLQPPKQHPKPQSSTKECIFFKKGCCKNGDKCPYLHTPQTNEAALVNKLQDLLQKYEQILPEANQLKRNQQSIETPKRLRVHDGDNGNSLGYGNQNRENFTVRANRAKKFSNQMIQMHQQYGNKKQEKHHSSIDDFVVRSREEILADLEAKKAAEAAKNTPNVQSSSTSQVPIGEGSTVNDGIDDEYKEDLEEMDRLLGNNS